MANNGDVTDLKTKADFEKAIKDHTMVVIDFTATWCGPCKMMKPKFEVLAKDNSDIHFCKVDVDENAETAEACEISAMPTFQCYKNGVQVKTLSITGADIDKLTQSVHSLKDAE